MALNISLNPLEASKERLAAYKDRHAGQHCVIIGNGPSLNQMDLSFLKKEITFGTNRIYLGFEKWDFTPTYYVSVNPLVLEQSAAEISKINAPKFISHHGLPFLTDSDQLMFLASLDSPCFSRDPRQGVWEGYTVTYVTMQLAYFMGFEQVILIGVDHSFTAPGQPNQEVVSGGTDPNHFHPDYFGKGVRWHLPDLQNSEVAYRMAKYAFNAEERTILDATVGGKLTIFPKVDYRQTFFQSQTGSSRPAPVLSPTVPPPDTTPLVSVIITTDGNRERTKTALQCVGKQTYPNLELVVVNSGGEDIEPLIHAGWPGRPFTLVSFHQERSRGATLNAGAALARGEYLAYLNDSDYFLPDHLTTLQVFLQSRSKYATVCAQSVPATTPREENGSKIPPRADAQPWRFNLDQLLVSPDIALVSLMHRKSVLSLLKGFDESLDLYADWDFMIRLGLLGDFLTLPVITCQYDPPGQVQPDSQAGLCALKQIYDRYSSYASNQTRRAQQAHYARLAGCAETIVAAGELNDEESEAALQDQASAGGEIQIRLAQLLGRTEPVCAKELDRQVNFFSTLLAAEDIVAFAESHRTELTPLFFALLSINKDTAHQDGNQPLVEMLERLEAILGRIAEDLPEAGAQNGVAPEPEDAGLQVTDQVAPAADQLPDEIKALEMKNLQQNWNTFGEKDPMWSILTRPDKKGNKWEPGEFFETGQRDIQALMDDLTRLGIAIPRRAALDFGCGYGRLSQALSLHFAEVYGIDIAPAMIAGARYHNRFRSKCRYLVNEADDLRIFADGQFDLIYTVITLQHIRPQYAKNYLREFMRVLSREGVLVFQLPSKHRGEPGSTSLQGVLSFNPGQPVMEMHGIEKNEVIQLLGENGGRVVHLVEDPSLGPSWESFRYWVRKDSAFA
jgi:ubiquinone/menaquinone biosynthesis C-methylase UbiE